MTSVAGKIFLRPSRSRMGHQGVHDAVIVCGVIEVPAGAFQGERMYPLMLGRTGEKAVLMLDGLAERTPPPLDDDYSQYNITGLVKAPIWRRSLGTLGDAFLRRTLVPASRAGHETFILASVMTTNGIERLGVPVEQVLRIQPSGTLPSIEPTGVAIPPGHTPSGILKLPLWGDDRNPVGLQGDMPLEILSAIDEHYRLLYVVGADAATVRDHAKEKKIEYIVSISRNDPTFDAAMRYYLARNRHHSLMTPLNKESIARLEKSMKEAIALAIHTENDIPARTKAHGM